MGEYLVSKAMFDAWSRAKKRELGPLAGLRFNRQSSGGWGFSRHWPHLLCWSWSAHVTPHRSKNDGARRFGFLFSPRLCKQISLRTPLGTIGFSWQNYERMAALGPHRPKVDWDGERRKDFWREIAGTDA